MQPHAAGYTLFNHSEPAAYPRFMTFTWIPYILYFLYYCITVTISDMFITPLHSDDHLYFVRFEVFTAVTMKNGVFWDVTPCGSCKNRRFGGT
jgi:hypothetical protein